MVDATTDIFPMRFYGPFGKEGQLNNVARFWDVVRHSYADNRTALFILETISKYPQLLKQDCPPDHLERLGYVVSFLSHSFSSFHISYGVENLFTLIAANPLTPDLLRAYGQARVVGTYNRLLNPRESRYFSYSARAAIIHALQKSPKTEKWIEELEGKGQDIVFLHSSNPDTAIDQQQTLQYVTQDKMASSWQREPTTHTLINTPEGTLWAWHNNAPKYISTVTIDWPFDRNTEQTEKYLKVLHALTIMAVERYQAAVDSGSNNPPFADMPKFLERVNAELSRRNLTPLPGFTPDERTQRAAGLNNLNKLAR